MSLAPTGKTLGQGSYATVKEAVQIKTGNRFAVKVISKKLMSGREHMILNEIEILKKVSKGHKSIVTLHDYFETPNNLYLVMDLCTGGELFDRICEKGSFYEEDAAEIVRTVCSAVAYLHDQNIVHRDIKPENMLYRTKDSMSDLVIADFGLSKIMNQSKFEGLMTTCGTPGYMAPEVILKTGHGKSVDMWSIGVMCYFLLCGYTPFDAGNGGQDEIQRVLHAKFSFTPQEYWVDISEKARDFIRACLLINPAARITAQQALVHPWLDEYAPVPPTDGSALPARKPTVDLLPNVKTRFDAKKTFKKGVDAIIALRKLKSISSSFSKLGGTDAGSSLTSESTALASTAEMDIDLENFRPNEEGGDDGSLMVINRTEVVSE